MLWFIYEFSLYLIEQKVSEGWVKNYLSEISGTKIRFSASDTNEQWEMINEHVKGLSDAVGLVILVRKRIFLQG